MTPDYAPIMGIVDELDGLVLSCGWGSWGFKAAPVAGKRIAELIATGETPDLIKPLALSRFKEGRLVKREGPAAPRCRYPLITGTYTIARPRRYGHDSVAAQSGGEVQGKLFQPHSSVTNSFFKLDTSRHRRFLPSSKLDDRSWQFLIMRERRSSRKLPQS